MDNHQLNSLTLSRLKLDMRYEASVRRSVESAGVLGAAWILFRDQVLNTFLWGFGWAFAREIFQLAKVAGVRTGTQWRHNAQQTLRLVFGDLFISTSS